LAVLGTGAAAADAGTRLLQRLRSEESFAANIEQALKQHGVQRAAPDKPLRDASPQELAALMFELLGPMDLAQWQALFDAPAASHTLGSDEVTLSALVQAGFDDGKQSLRSVAQQRADATGAKVVVLGHTHQPDTHRLDGDAMYYNPGCWTRYLELKAGQSVTLADLRDESRYPYQLNVVRISPRGDGSLTSRMACFEQG
jgi:hypothetical protein